MLDSAAAAMGVLYVIRSHVSRGSYWRESYHASAAPSFLTLLALMLPRQPRLHSKVISCHSSPRHQLCCTLMQSNATIIRISLASLESPSSKPKPSRKTAFA